MAGSRMLTAEVLALTTRVATQVAASTPMPTFPVDGVPAAGCASSVLIAGILGHTPRPWSPPKEAKRHAEPAGDRDLRASANDGRERHDHADGVEVRQLHGCRPGGPHPGGA